jgi:hypothetical protein
MQLTQCLTLSHSSPNVLWNRIKRQGKITGVKNEWISTLLGDKVLLHPPTFLAGISLGGGIVGFTTAKTKA